MDRHGQWRGTVNGSLTVLFLSLKIADFIMYPLSEKFFGCTNSLASERWRGKSFNEKTLNRKTLTGVSRWIIEFRWIGVSRWIGVFRWIGVSRWIGVFRWLGVFRWIGLSRWIRVFRWIGVFRWIVEFRWITGLFLANYAHCPSSGKSVVLITLALLGHGPNCSRKGPHSKQGVFYSHCGPQIFLSQMLGMNIENNLAEHNRSKPAPCNSVNRTTNNITYNIEHDNKWADL